MRTALADKFVMNMIISKTMLPTFEKGLFS